MQIVILSAMGLWVTMLVGCGAKQTGLPSTVDEPLPVLDSALQQSIPQSWLETTSHQDKVFGCLHGDLTHSSRGASAIRAVRMQLAPIDPVECSGSDAIGVVWFFGPRPSNAIGYNLDVASQQQRLFCLHRDWLLVGVAYDTASQRLRTSWIVRTPSAGAQCANAGNREAVFDSREINLALSLTPK